MMYLFQYLDTKIYRVLYGLNLEDAINKLQHPEFYHLRGVLDPEQLDIKFTQSSLPIINTMPIRRVA